MKVELLVSRAGPDGAHNRGEIIDVPADEAARMIEAGQAIPVRGAPVEKAVRAVKVEKAAR